jgi:integrase
VAFIDGRGETTVTIAAVLAWVQDREGVGSATVSPRRVTAVRGFARFLSGIDPATEVPPLGLVPYRRRRGQIFLYSNADIAAILAAARETIAEPLRAATYHTLIGLLASSGLRIGEAIKLDRGDIDWDRGVLHIRETKFGKSRLVPLHGSAVTALREYDVLRDQLRPVVKDQSFFISRTARRLIYAVVCPTFRTLVQAAGVGTDAPHPPRLHELRHIVSA